MLAASPLPFAIRDVIDALYFTLPPPGAACLPLYTIFAMILLTPDDKIIFRGRQPCNACLITPRHAAPLSFSCRLPRYALFCYRLVAVIYRRATLMPPPPDTPCRQMFRRCRRSAPLSPDYYRRCQPLIRCRRLRRHFSMPLRRLRRH